MASAIDATKPVAGNPTTESVRLNFAAAKSEIELLQQTAGVGPQGPVGPTGPSGTISVGTVTTGAAGTSAAVTNTGSSTAATFNFTLPRGDSGTGGSGITEQQAKDAVAEGNIKFLESPETQAPTFPTTPNLAGAPTLGANWTLASGTGATGTYTHAIGSTETLAYPATIANGTVYQVIFTMTNVAATSTALSSFFTIYFRTAPTTTTGQQTVQSAASAGGTVTITATGNFSYVVVVPVTGWQGNFSMTRVVAFSGAQNSVAFSIKDWEVRARTTSLFIGTGGTISTGGGNIALGSGALSVLTTGTNNVAIGVNVLTRNGTGSTNIAIGSSTMSASLSGSSNIAIGGSAMSSIMTGSTNIAIGGSAMSDNQTGGENTALGSNAGRGVRTGSYNIGLGSYALGGYSGSFGENPAASRNIAIGYYAMHVTPFGTDNIAIGYRALSKAAEDIAPAPTTGSGNIGIGENAGRYLASGLAPIFLTLSENCIFLGGRSRSNVDDVQNSISIGYNAVGHGSNTITLGNSSITALHCQVQTISALSDSRMKENVQPASLSVCLDAVKNLPLSQWDWLPISGLHANKHDVGFLADDVAKVFPKAVTKEDRFMTVRDADGKPQIDTVTEAIWTAPDQTPDAAAPRTRTRQIEKTQEFKDLCYVSTSDMLPALWGAVQQLIQRIEQLEKPADSNPDNPGADPAPKQGFFRGKRS